MDNDNTKRSIKIMAGIMAICVAAIELLVGSPDFLDRGRWGGVHQLVNGLLGQYGWPAIHTLIGVCCLGSALKLDTK